jgi:hypothetical protein
MISIRGNSSSVSLALGTAFLLTCCLKTEAADTTRIDEVWAKEDLYWQRSEHGDVEAYLALWDADALAWPSDTEHPLSKTDLSRRLSERGRPRVGLVSGLTREGATDLGASVIVYYEATQQRSFADGHQDAPRRVKITHVWKKVGREWLLVGGQAAPL